MKLWPLHRRVLIKKLINLWYKWPKIWWNHEYLINNNNHRIVIPNTHSWKDISIPILNAIIRQLWITRDKFLEL